MHAYITPWLTADQLKQEGKKAMITEHCEAREEDRSGLDGGQAAHQHWRQEGFWKSGTV